MPTWKTHTEGGSWNGGGTQVTDCSDAEIKNLTAQYDFFINSPCLDCFGGLRSCMKAHWEGGGGSWTGGNGVEISCIAPGCNTDFLGEESGTSIVICDNQGSTLIHELSHVCGTVELDAVAAENACFFGNGAGSPSNDWNFIRDGCGGTNALYGDENVRVGQFVIWDTQTGQVWSKTSDESGRTVRGGLCFQHNNWIHTYPAPAGGGW
jgi:hypothetical protein